MSFRPGRGVFFLAGGIICFAVAALIVSFFSGRAGDEAPTAKAGPIPSFVAEEKLPEKEKSAAEPWIIYITGKIRHPGIYEVEPDSRVFHAVEKAGGLLVEADQTGINLARRLEDGCHVHVPGEKDIQETPAVFALESEKNLSGDETAPAPMSDTPETIVPDGSRININSAGLSSLQKLPGIGPVTAEKIIDYRKEHGRFTVISELIMIKGIGEKKLEQIRPFVFVGP